jgi:hypothetical protein
MTLWGRETEGLQNHGKPSVCMYLWPPTQRHPAKQPYLNRYKAKLFCLQAGQIQTDLPDTSAHDCLEDEEPSLYHIIRTKQRKEQWEIREAIDHTGTLHTTPHEITRVFMQHFTGLLAPCRVEDETIHAILSVIQPPLHCTQWARFIQKLAKIQFLQVQAINL